jgi:hypothetical protein
MEATLFTIVLIAHQGTTVMILALLHILIMDVLLAIIALIMLHHRLYNAQLELIFLLLEHLLYQVV